MIDSSQNSNSDNSSIYRSILKGSSIFGGVQIFIILINLIRGKFVAMFLGPEGMGISSLFTSSSNTIVKASSLGLNLAIVKEVAKYDNDRVSLNKLLAILASLIRITAFLGAVICVLFSNYLSELSFNSCDYSWQYMLLGAAVFFTIAGNAKLSILQGLHEVKKIARASIAGALSGLFAGVPLYYLWGNKGIVPAMVIFSLTTYLFYRFSVTAISSNYNITWKEKFPLIKKLISIGIVLMAGDIIGTIVTYLINIYIRQNGDLDSVGLYQAANSITNQYAGIVFSALAMDYLPRLSKVVKDRGKMCDIVNKQSEIVVLLIIPIVILVITSSPLIIKILLTNSFNSILNLLRWMAVGIALRGISFPLGYITFANDNKKVFFLLEGVFTNVIYLLTSILGFHFFGLIGLGYAIVADSIISIIVYLIVNYYLYGFKFNNKIIREFCIGMIFVTTTIVISFLSFKILSYSVMTIILLVSFIYSAIRIKKLISNVSL